MNANIGIYPYHKRMPLHFPCLLQFAKRSQYIKTQWTSRKTCLKNPSLKNISLPRTRIIKYWVEAQWGQVLHFKKALVLKPFPSPWGEGCHFSSKGNDAFLKVPIEGALVNLADADVITLQGSDLRKKGLESMGV